MVRLKVKIVEKHKKANEISIPYGAIKRRIGGANGI